VLRDFALDLVDEDGERLTPNEYLEKALAAQPGFDKATAERNRVRHMLTAFFVERQCCTLVRPLADEAQLQKVDDVPYRALRREFRRALEDFKAGLFTGMKPKALRGRALTGPMFAGLAAAYVEAINAGGVPVIASAWDGVSRQESQAAAADGARVLRERLAEKFGAAPERSGLPAAEAALDEAFEAAAEEARAAYGKRAVGAEAAAFRAELEEALAAERAELAARLEAQGVRLGKATSALAAAEVSLEEAREEGAARADALRRRSAEHEEDDHKLASKNNGKAGGGDLNKDVEELEGVLRKKNEEILELQAQIDLAVQSKGCGGANSGCLLS